MAHFRSRRNGSDQAETSPCSSLGEYSRSRPLRATGFEGCGGSNVPPAGAFRPASAHSQSASALGAERGASCHRQAANRFRQPRPHRASECRYAISPTAQPRLKAVLAVQATGRWPPSLWQGRRPLSGRFALSTARSHGEIDSGNFAPVWHPSLSPYLEAPNQSLTSHWTSCYLWD